MTDAHGQAAHAVRFEWGLTGAAAIAEGAQLAVVVDVLSFTTTLCVAAEFGVRVYPYRWGDETAAEYAAERGATLAVGRFDPSGVSTRPASACRRPACWPSWPGLAWSAWSCPPRTDLPSPSTLPARG